MQQHKRVSVFRPKQQVEQEPKQEHKQVSVFQPKRVGQQPKAQQNRFEELAQQAAEQLKQANPEMYKEIMEAPRTDETPPCVDPDE